MTAKKGEEAVRKIAGNLKVRRQTRESKMFLTKTQNQTRILTFTTIQRFV